MLGKSYSTFEVHGNFLILGCDVCNDGDGWLKLLPLEDEVLLEISRTSSSVLVMPDSSNYLRIYWTTTRVG